MAYVEVRELVEVFDDVWDFLEFIRANVEMGQLHSVFKGRES